MLLIGSNWLLQFDCYLLRFGEGAAIPAHTDRLDSGYHYRLNIIVKKAKQGGDFICQTCIFETDRIKLFRPDLYEHAVSKVERGQRYVLSIGWVRKASSKR